MLDFLGELFTYIRTRKKFWLIPIFVMMLLLGLVLVFGQGSAVTPFIYTIF